MAQVPRLARMLVLMVGSSGVLVLLSGDHARFVAVPQRGQKNPARGGAVTEEGAAPSRSMRASPSSPAGTAARQPPLMRASIACLSASYRLCHWALLLGQIRPSRSIGVYGSSSLEACCVGSVASLTLSAPKNAAISCATQAMFKR